MTRPKPTMSGLQLREWMKYRGYTDEEGKRAPHGLITCDAIPFAGESVMPLKASPSSSHLTPLGRRLRRFRATQGYRILDIARDLEVNSTTIVAWEWGREPWPDDIEARLSDLYGDDWASAESARHPKSTMTGLQLREWAKHRGYTHEEAAFALGLNKHMFSLYLHQDHLPETIRLAVIGYEAERNHPITGVTE